LQQDVTRGRNVFNARLKLFDVLVLVAATGSTAMDQPQQKLVGQIGPLQHAGHRGRYQWQNVVAGAAQLP